jgi:hypothetical protein
VKKRVGEKDKKEEKKSNFVCCEKTNQREKKRCERKNGKIIVATATMNFQI